MSGIFGIISIGKIAPKDCAGLKIWNENYGDLDTLEFSDEGIYLGVKPELMKSYSDVGSNALCRKNGKIGVFDSAIFSDKKCNLSDEEFLFTEIQNGGTDSLKSINGDYAGAIWDAEKKELLLFRDHMGVRPLFYYCDEEKVVFSTDIRGITSIKSVDASIDQTWLYEKVSKFSTLSATDTEYEHIKCVPFGGYISFSPGSGKIEKREGHYWVPGEKKVRMGSREEYTKELRRLVEDAVKVRAMATEHKLGGELSGGLDSGVVDVLLSQLKKDCYFFSWTPKVEELPYAENDERFVINDICEKAGIKCNFGELSVDFEKLPLLKERLPISDDYSDMFFSIRYLFPCYLNTTQIYETASFMREKGVKIIFTGHGGDEGASHRSNPYELFYNHEYYRYLRLMYSRSSIKKPRLLTTAILIRDNLKVAKENLTKPFSMGNGTNPLIKKSLSERFKNSEMQPLYFAYDPVKYINGGGSRNRLDVLAFYSACTGVRYFAPLLDYRVVDFALGIPRYLYHNWYYDRFIFREAFKDIIPHSLYKLRVKEDNSYKNLQKKEGQQIPDEAEIAKMKKRYAAMLDREYWKDCLDFEVLDDWAEGKGRAEDEVPILTAVLSCIQAQLLVKRSREVAIDKGF